MFHLNRRREHLIFLCRALSPWMDAQAVRESLPDTDWEGVVAIANSYFLAPALWAGLHRKGLLDELESELREYLTEMYSFNERRNRDLLAELEEVTSLLNAEGIEPLLMKGAAALVASGPYPGARFMMDLDIWVRPESLEVAADALGRAGWVPPADKNYSANAHHLPGLYRPGAVAHVELHRRLLHDEPPGKSLVDEAQTVAVTLGNGARARVMTPLFQLLHNVLHSEVSHDAYGLAYLDLRQMVNFALLAQRQEQVEWGRLEKMMQARGLGTIWSAYAHAQSRLFGHAGGSAQAAGARIHFSVRLLLFSLGPRAVWLGQFLSFIQRARNVFSRSNLEGRYGPQWQPVTHRLSHMRYLLGKYRRLEPWQRLSSSFRRSLRGWSGEC